LAIGRFLCFAKGDWVAGLPHLVNGSDSALKSAAQKEAGKPATPEERKALADEWLGIAQKETGLARVAVLSRGWYWLKNAEAGLTGFEKTRAVAALANTEAEIEKLDPEVAARKEDIPLPRIAYRGCRERTYNYPDRGPTTQVCYYLAITNVEAYPDWIFEKIERKVTTAKGETSTYASPRFIAMVCDPKGEHLTGWSVRDREFMRTGIYFYLPKGVKPPPVVYVALEDQKEQKDQKLRRKYKSNLVAIDPAKESKDP
jgi:hypothetical protein